MGFFRRLLGRWFGAGDRAALPHAAPETPPDSAERPSATPDEAAAPRRPPFPWARPAAPRPPQPVEDLPTRAARTLALLDTAIERLSEAILQDPRRLRLEASWRGLHGLAAAATGPIVLRILPVSQDELARESARSHEAGRHPLFLLQQAEREARDGAPLGLLLADFEWTSEFRDTHTLRALAGVAAAMQAPLITGAAPALLGLNAWSEAPAPEGCLDALPERWREFRRDPASGHALPVMPRILARAVEGAAPACWVNGGWLLAFQVASAFRSNGLGAGALGLPRGSEFRTPECPIEAAEVAEVARHGILALTVAEDGSLTAGPAAAAAGLPALVVETRMAQCLAMMARERLRRRGIGDCDGLRAAIEEWFARYLKPDAQFIRPLYQAQVTVDADAGRPGHWRIALRFRLWPPGDALSVPLRAVVTIPAPG